MRKETAASFMPDMVNAILEDRKTMTRRKIKNQPTIDPKTGDWYMESFNEVVPIEDWVKTVENGPCPYGKPGDDIFLSFSLQSDGIYIIFTTINEFEYGKVNFETNPSIPERGLHGWKRWVYLLSNEIQGIWKEGFCGLVSFGWASEQKRILNCFLVSQRKEDYKERSQAHLSVISWRTGNKINAGKAFGWESEQQQTDKSCMGDTGRKLDGQEVTWTRNNRRETSNEQVDGQREGAYSMVLQTGDFITTSYCEDVGDVTIRHTTDLPRLSSILYVREAHYMYGNWIEDEGEFTATGKQKWKFIQCKKEVLFTKPEGIEVRGGKNSKDPYALMWHKRLARFMPKSAARIWMEVVSVKVERLNDISPGDAIDEGVEYWNIDGESMEGGELVADFNNYTWTEEKENDPNYADRNFPVFANSVDSFRTLWQSINGTDSWDANPWVWAVRFKVISKTGKP